MQSDVTRKTNLLTPRCTVRYCALPRSSETCVELVCLRYMNYLILTTYLVGGLVAINFIFPLILGISNHPN